jgi:uncharacterized tellurite resistance protein B-like protein
MLKAIQDFYKQFISTETATDDTQHRLQLATTALLVEMMRMDEEIHEAERVVLLQAVSEKFGITADEAAQIISLAEAELQDATDYHQFTTIINREFEYDKKIRIVEYLWSIAAADRHIDRYEEHMVRKISELLYVSHRDFVAAKHRVLGE